MSREFEIAEKYADRCIAELESSHDAQLTIQNAIEDAIDEILLEKSRG